MIDPALNMTIDDLRFIAELDMQLDDAARYDYRRDDLRRPCPGCAEPCRQCDADATD